MPRVIHRLPYGPQAPAAARDALAALDGHIGREELEKLRLLVSELVTNSVRHGEPSPDGVHLEVAVEADCARVAVMDGGRGFVPPPGPPEASYAGGWGLVVVDRLARRWGVDDNGKTRVWLELDLAGSG
jgi:anti-sigma regulatory factor (Ser/Thr protein kinase)